MKWIVKLLALVNFISVINCIDKKINEDIWHQDLTDSFKIDASTEGLEKVQLKCGSDSMHVELVTKEDFNGVMYTRGSFYKQKEPCFVKPKRGQRSLKMKFQLNQCQTIQDGDVFSNVIVVQHDPELVTTGDAAFQLECDFRKPRSINVGADYQARESQKFTSRIILTSPDPSAITQQKRNKRDTVTSDTDTVTFIPIHTDADDNANEINDDIAFKHERKIRAAVKSSRSSSSGVNQKPHV